MNDVIELWKIRDNKRYIWTVSPSGEFLYDLVVSSSSDDVWYRKGKDVVHYSRLLWHGNNLDIDDQTYSKHHEDKIIEH
jgi:hypothetical protein